MNYAEFLKTKENIAQEVGIDVSELNPMLFEFQRDIVRWALRKGRAAIFADCGLGKTPMQLEWAKHVSAHTSKPVLIIAPLAVTSQTAKEGHKFNIPVKIVRDQNQIMGGLNITNYEMLDHFEPSAFGGVVLDESSILKSFTGKFRTEIIRRYRNCQFRLACTATPAPNDHMELGNHSEFLGVATRIEMFTMFFVHDGGSTQNWRIKGHAEKAFWKWVCSWAVMIRKPSDLGYEDDGFILPKLQFHDHRVDSDAPDGFLFPVRAQTLQERLSVRRNSIEDRVDRLAHIVNGSNEPWIVWCNLNRESELATRAIEGSREVRGSNDSDVKEANLIGFSEGEFTKLVTKPSIAGFGMNWQHCHNVAFLGLSDSYEQFYQAVRRCWRFGQTKPVQVHIITAESEGAVLDNIRRKERDAERMITGMIANMSEITKFELKQSGGLDMEYATEKIGREKWEIVLGDCVEKTKELADGCIHYSIFSPPFASLYSYSNSARDMGNSRNEDQFHEHFRFLITELYRIIKTGRLVSVHCMNLPTSKIRHGYIGISDFRGDVIRSFLAAGFIFHSEVCIWKDPVTAMQRTKALGLLHKQLKKDASMSRMGIPDYVCTFRKPGENPEPITNTNETYPVKVWQNVASPIWTDISQSDTLQYRSAREHKDEKHIAPLQLEVIRRCVRLWTNPGDVVLSPFAGIGSEGFVSVSMGRRFHGIELKRSYFDQMKLNLERAEMIAHDADRDLFSAAEVRDR